MSEFHRMVTYLYLYEGNTKTRNVGYAKIEKRDAQCRVEIHMKNTGLIDNNVPVYFYTQNNAGFPGILLGSINLVRGMGDFKELLDSSNLINSNYSISDIKGIFLPISDHEMILSQWDDDSFDRNTFLTDETQVPPVIDVQAAEAAPVLYDEPFESTPTKNTNAKPVEPPSPRWDFIMENFPSIAPFPTEDSFQWVRLDLKDLRLLPKPYWYLGNNSFLLHGFFNYHHLLLGRKKDTQTAQWSLGIPGVFQNPERVMATIFGFPEFRSVSESDTKTNQFGYWLRSLN